MTTRKYFSLILALFLMVSCHTRRQVQNVQDVPSQPVVAQHTIDTRPLSTEPDTLAIYTSSRANINKVTRREASTWQGALQARLDSLTSIDLFETTLLGLCVFDLTDDCMLYAVNSNQRIRPASNQKLVTAISALDILGTNYRYTPTLLQPGWGWCWDDEETGITEFDAGGKRYNADTLYCESREWTLGEVLVPMMKKSDNMLAESLFWQLPGKKNLSEVKRKDCSAKAEGVIRKTGLNPSNYVIADGSGVSLYNYISPNALLMLLRHAYRNKRIFDALYPALPIAGVDGTLSKRMTGTPAENNVHAKTGTVTGVSTLSGYCTHSSGHTLAFSIMNQGISKAAVGRDYQDKVCVVLTE